MATMIKHGGLDARAPRAGAEKSPPKELEHIRVAQAENDGHTADHHFKSFEHPPEGPYVFPAVKEKVALHRGSLLHHIAKHMGIPHTVIAEAAPAIHNKEEQHVEEGANKIEEAEEEE